MAYDPSVFSQLLKLVPRYQFESLVPSHQKGQKLRRMSRWSQFVAMSAGQLCARRSLRDIVANLAAQQRRLYHLGAGAVSRSSLARVNEQQPYQLYEALFFKLYARCQPLAPKHRLRIRSPLFSLDASLIDLSLKIFPWAQLSRK